MDNQGKTAAILKLIPLVICSLSLWLESCTRPKGRPAAIDYKQHRPTVSEMDTLLLRFKRQALDIGNDTLIKGNYRYKLTPESETNK